MHELRFSTPDPLDHCARMLDVLRRMGFGLMSVCATPVPNERFDVRMSFRPAGDLSPELLANRISGFVGVAGVELSAVSEAVAA